MSAPQIVLHIGAMKTGTTYVQRMLGSNSKLLAAEGINYPQPWSEQVVAVRDVLQLKGGSHLGSIDGRWLQLVEQIHSSELDRAIISVEFLSFADADQVAELVESLRPSDVRVVLGVRDLARGLPAQWQTAVRNGRQVTYRDYVKGLTRGRTSRHHQHFWKRQDAGKIAARWASVVGRDNVSVVTVPPRGSDPGELWRRMAQAMRITNVELRQKSPSNESLGPTATELLRRINVQTRADGMSTWAYQHGVNRALSHAVLPQIPDSRPSLTAPKSAHEWVVAQSERVVNDLRASGAEIVGSLDDLSPDLKEDPSWVWPEDIPDEEVLGIAVAALSAFAENSAALKRKRHSSIPDDDGTGRSVDDDGDADLDA